MVSGVIRWAPIVYLVFHYELYFIVFNPQHSLWYQGMLFPFIEISYKGKMFV